MAERIIESVDVKPAPLRIVLGSQALEGTDFEGQTELAASTDFPPGGVTGGRVVASRCPSKQRAG